jgi:hypothetical protein
MKFVIRDALPGDSEKLIKLTRLSPMKGTIGLRIDRTPDFFSLLKLSESFIALVAENIDKEIIGSFVATKNQLCIMQKVTTGYYLRDLKIHPDYKGNSIAYMLVKKMYERLKALQADILYCTAADGNSTVMPFFTGRAGIPAFVTAGTFNVYQLLPKLNNKQNALQSKLNKQGVQFFMDEYAKRYSFYSANIQKDISDGGINFSLVNNETITAAVNAFDAAAYKQNIVTSHSCSIGLLLLLIRCLKVFLPISRLPKKNEPLKILYARYYAYTKEKGNNLIALLNKLRAYAYDKQYHFVSIAADEKDKDTNQIIKPLSKFIFRSALMITSLQNNKELLQQICNGIKFEDYALV